jgi:hypothetical protein
MQCHNEYTKSERSDKGPTAIFASIKPRTFFNAVGEFLHLVGDLAGLGERRHAQASTSVSLKA